MIEDFPTATPTVEFVTGEMTELTAVNVLDAVDVVAVVACAAVLVREDFIDDELSACIVPD